jgi:hypothetical protein
VTALLNTVLVSFTKVITAKLSLTSLEETKGTEAVNTENWVLELWTVRTER